MALTYLLNEKIEVDFDGGETLLRYYDPAKELWSNTAVTMPPRRPIITPKLIIDDELLTARLKKRKRNGARFKFELVYLPVPIQENNGVRPLPQMALLIDGESARLLGQHMADNDDNIEVDIIEMLARTIEESGRPASIRVRDNRAGRYIEDFCQKIDVKRQKGSRR
jgi:hypothetical protein